MTGAGNAGDRWRTVLYDWFFNRANVCQSKSVRQRGTW